MHAWEWRPNWDWVKGRGAEVRGGRSPGWRRQGSGAQDVVCGRMIDTSPLLELAPPQPRSLLGGQGNTILGCQGISLREHSGKTASRRGFRITQQPNAEALSMGWRVRGCRGRHRGTLGFCHTHIHTSQLGEGRQRRTAGHNGTHLPRTWAPRRLKAAERGFQEEAGNFPQQTSEPAPGGALAAP